MLQRPFTDEQIQKKRQKYLDKAYAIAEQLEARWNQKAPKWFETSGDAKVDAIVEYYGWKICEFDPLPTETQ